MRAAVSWQFYVGLRGVRPGFFRPVRNRMFPARTKCGNTAVALAIVVLLITVTACKLTTVNRSDDHERVFAQNGQFPTETDFKSPAFVPSAFQNAATSTWLSTGNRIKLDFIPLPERLTRQSDGYGGVQAPEGSYAVEGHGSPDYIISRTGRQISPGELSAWIRRDPRYSPGVPVTLFSCDTGKGREPFAQRLASLRRIGRGNLFPVHGGVCYRYV